MTIGLILGEALVPRPMFPTSIKKIKLPLFSFKGELSVEETPVSLPSVCAVPILSSFELQALCVRVEQFTSLTLQTG